MIARIITYSAESIALLLAPPDWSQPVQLDLELPADIDRTLISKRESRRVFGRSARYTLTYRASLADANESTELRIWLARVKGETVAVPLWTDPVLLTADISEGDTSLAVDVQPVRYGAEWIILADDLSAYEIVTTNSVTGSTITLTSGTANDWTAGTCALFPLLFGRLAEQPKVEGITDEALQADLKIKENSPFARRLNPFAGSLPTVGSSVPGFTTVPLFDIVPHFNRPLDWNDNDIDRRSIGFGRVEQQRVYPQATRRGQELEFYQSGRAEMTRIERFFVSQRASTLPFMVPTFRGDLRLSADVAIGATTMSIEANEFTDPGRLAQPGDPYIALIDDAGVDPRKVSVPNTTTLTLVGSTATRAHQAQSTIISHLLYARFADKKLSWQYLTDGKATTRIKFAELSSEYIAPPAALAEPVYLFIFTEQLPTPQISRFTSYEDSVVIASGPYAGTYTPAPFSFGSVKTGLKLDKEELQLTSFPFSGNPISKFFPFALDGVLSIDVLEVNALDLTAAAIVRFAGEVWETNLDYKTKCLAFGQFFEKRFPRFLLAVTDNYTQFSAPTHISASTFKITGTIAALSVPNRTVDVTSSPANLKATDYFAAGWLEIGSGAAFERRSILHSVAITGGVRLTLDRPLLKSAVSASIDLYPGYDGTIDTCESKFSNRINFGGHPYVPDTNPAVKAVKAKQVKGGKK
jgi:hypothetical protein